MSIHDAKAQLERAFAKASKEIDAEIDGILRYIKAQDQAVYTPSKGDVVSLLYTQSPPRRREAIITEVWDDHEGYGLVIGCHLDFDSRKQLRFSISSESGRSMVFLRRATPAEMAQVGLVEKDVEPAKPVSLGDYTGPIEAVNFHGMRVRVGRWGNSDTRHAIHTDDGKGGNNWNWVATVKDRDTAVEVANRMFGWGPGNELPWKRCF